MPGVWLGVVRAGLCDKWLAPLSQATPALLIAGKLGNAGRGRANTRCCTSWLPAMLSARNRGTLRTRAANVSPASHTPDLQLGSTTSFHFFVQAVLLNPKPELCRPHGRTTQSPKPKKHPKPEPRAKLSDLKSRPSRSEPKRHLLNRGALSCLIRWTLGLSWFQSGGWSAVLVAEAPATLLWCFAYSCCLGDP